MNKLKLLLPTLLMIVLEIAIGVLLIIDGEKFTTIIFMIFGIFMLLSGIVMLIRSIAASRSGGSIPLGQLILSVVLIAIGAFFVAAAGSIVSIFTVITLIYGIIMLVSGVVKLVDYATSRRSGMATVATLISAIVSIVIGVIIMINPFGAREAMWVILGVMIIVSAVVDIISLIFFAKALRNTKVTVIEAEVQDIDE